MCSDAQAVVRDIDLPSSENDKQQYVESILEEYPLEGQTGFYVDGDKMVLYGPSQKVDSWQGKEAIAEDVSTDEP